MTRYSWPLRFILLLYALCFLGGGFTHARDLWADGFLPYPFAPLWPNIYWTSLTFFDPLAAVLVLWRPRAGLVLAVLIMVSDVAINSYVSYGLPDWGFRSGLDLQLQSLFLGFVLGSCPFLWVRVKEK
jgi:hypothetical protein